MRDADRGRLSPSSILPGAAGQTRHLIHRAPLTRASRPGLFTFVRVLSRRLLVHLGVATLLALGLVLVEPAPVDREPSLPSHDMPWSQVEVLILENGCWSGAAPAGVRAGHAVVALPGDPASLVPAGTGFAIWLGPDGLAGSGDERPGRLFAFCP